MNDCSRSIQLSCFNWRSHITARHACVALSIASILFMIQLLGCAKNLDYELDASNFDPARMKLVEEKTGLRLPPGARGLNLFYSGNQIDPSFLARIEIPATEQASLTREIETKSKAGEGRISADQLKARVAWWHPEKGMLLIERVYSHQMNGVQLLLCEEDRRHVLYILWVKV